MDWSIKEAKRREAARKQFSEGNTTATDDLSPEFISANDGEDEKHHLMVAEVGEPLV